jgi:hypothetical protein
MAIKYYKNDLDALAQFERNQLIAARIPKELNDEVELFSAHLRTQYIKKTKSDIINDALIYYIKNNHNFQGKLFNDNG